MQFKKETAFRATKKNWKALEKLGYTLNARFTCDQIISSACYFKTDVLIIKTNNKFIWDGCGSATTKIQEMVVPTKFKLK